MDPIYAWLIALGVIIAGVVAVAYFSNQKEEGQELIEASGDNLNEDGNLEYISVKAANGSKVRARRRVAGGGVGVGTPNVINIYGGGGPATPPPGVPPAPAAPTAAQPGGMGQPVEITAPAAPVGTITVLVQYALGGAAYGGAAQAVAPGGIFRIPGIVSAGTQVRARAALITNGGRSPWSADFVHQVI